MDLSRSKTNSWQIALNVLALCFGVLFLLNVGAVIQETERCERELYKVGALPWEPYSSSVENALMLLHRVRPEQARYLQERHIPIVVLAHEAFRKRFGDARAETENRSVVYVDEVYARDPQHLAAALSHEEVHVEHGDRRTQLGQHSWLRHWLLQGEEDEAHLQGDTTLLRITGLTGWTASEYLDAAFRGWHWWMPLLWLLLFLKAVRASVTVSFGRLRRSQ